jgi:hypothetical protein
MKARKDQKHENGGTKNHYYKNGFTKNHEITNGTLLNGSCHHNNNNNNREHVRRISYDSFFTKFFTNIKTKKKNQ